MGNSPVTGEFPVQMDSNAENVSIWWRHHENSEQRTSSSDVDATKCDTKPRRDNDRVINYVGFGAEIDLFAMQNVVISVTK